MNPKINSDSIRLFRVSEDPNVKLFHPRLLRRNELDPNVGLFTQNQQDELIDNGKLSVDFLNMYDRLGLLVDYDESDEKDDESQSMSL